MGSNQQHISTSNHDGALVITVLDQRLTEVDQVNDWQHQMDEAIRRACPSGVVIDMKNVEYMASVAMLPLIATRAVTEELGVRVMLCNLSATVLKTLTVAQLIVESREHARHLALADKLDDALLALSR